jgi:hypothetical protein
VRKCIEGFVALFILFPIAYIFKLYNLYHDYLFERKRRNKKSLW